MTIDPDRKRIAAERIISDRLLRRACNHRNLLLRPPEVHLQSGERKRYAALAREYMELAQGVDTIRKKRSIMDSILRREFDSNIFSVHGEFLRAEVQHLRTQGDEDE